MTKELTQAFNTMEGLSFHLHPHPPPAKWLFQSCHQSLTQAVGMAKNWQAHCFEELDVEEAPITSHISLSH